MWKWTKLSSAAKRETCSLAQRRRRITGTGTKDKTAVMGILERGGKVRTIVVPNRKKAALQGEVRKHVEAGAALYTDALLSYDGLAGDYAHRLWTMLSSTFLERATRMVLRIFGLCSSAASLARMFRLNHFTYSGTSTNKPFGLTTART